MRKVLVYNGGAVALEPFPGGSESSGGYLHQATVSPDNAQILGWPTTPITIAAAQPNRIYLPQLIVIANTLAVDYAALSISATYADIYVLPAQAQFMSLFVKQADPAVNNLTTLFLTSGVPVVATMQPVPLAVSAFMLSAYTVAQASVANQPLQLGMTNDADLTGGDPANEWDIAALYYLFDVSAGLFVAA